MNIDEAAYDLLPWRAHELIKMLDWQHLEWDDETFNSTARFVRNVAASILIKKFKSHGNWDVLEVSSAETIGFMSEFIDTNDAAWTDALAYLIGCLDTLLSITANANGGL